MLFRRFFPLVLSLALTACFTPLYGVKSDGTSARTHMKNIDVAIIGGRTGINLRNDLIFAFSGDGGETETPLYRMHTTLETKASLLVVDTLAGRPQNESYTIVVNYRITDIKSGQEIFKNSAFATASIDSAQQRYARDRARLDAYDRATKTAGDQAVTQIATFFATR
jgi:LPS-assembly lipoprotein